MEIFVCTIIIVPHKKFTKESRNLFIVFFFKWTTQQVSMQQKLQQIRNSSSLGIELITVSMASKPYFLSLLCKSTAVQHA